MKSTHLFSKNFHELDISDIEALVSSDADESAYLEFKRQVDDPNQWLREVCAFANGFGGDLLIGVEDENGSASEIVGVSVERGDFEQFALSFAQRLETRIEPPPAAQVRLYPVGEERAVVHIRVDFSVAKPHRMRDGHFMERVGASSRKMSYESVRAAFGHAQRLEDLAVSHHRTRSLNHPYASAREGVALVFMHLIPVASVEGLVQLPVAQRGLTELVHPPGGGSSVRIDQHGVLVSESGAEIGRGCHNGRTGVIECYFSIQSNDQHGVVAKWWVRDINAFIVASFRSAATWLNENGVAGPAWAMLSIVSARGIRGWTRYPDEDLTPQCHDETVVAPIVFLPSMDEDPANYLQLALDVVYNSMGHQRCPGFDENGNWVS